MAAPERREKRPLDRGDPRSWQSAYQAAVLGISAVVIVAALLFVNSAFQSVVSAQGSVSTGLEVFTQVFSAIRPHGPAASAVPGIVGTASPTPSSTRTPTLVPTSTLTPTFTPSPTSTPDVRFYDPARS